MYTLTMKETLPSSAPELQLWRPASCQNAQRRKKLRHQVKRGKFSKGVKYEKFYGELSYGDTLDYEAGPTFSVVGRTADEKLVLERGDIHYTIPFDGVVSMYEKEKFWVPVSLIEDGTIEVLRKLDSGFWVVSYHDEEYLVYTDLSDNAIVDQDNTGNIKLVGNWKERQVIRGGAVPQPVKVY